MCATGAWKTWELLSCGLILMQARISCKHGAGSRRSPHLTRISKCAVNQTQHDARDRAADGRLPHILARQGIGGLQDRGKKDFAKCARMNREQGALRSN